MVQISYYNTCVPVAVKRREEKRREKKFVLIAVLASNWRFNYSTLNEKKRMKARKRVKKEVFQIGPKCEMMEGEKSMRNVPNLIPIVVSAFNDSLKIQSICVNYAILQHYKSEP